MAVYKFYAVFEKVDEAVIVTFPDLENVYTDGETLIDAMSNAYDVLETMLVEMEQDGEVIPPASKAEDLKGKLPEGASLIYIEVDTEIDSK
ncbi:type II toxin-antitoxin system HicB family antitoxin [Niallia circulans]|uniref:type II toxin-antitoxin system HicB family antitoxin n=1 Tax=Niallia circulans TaxID=1397 RepID=UPI0026E93F02|nr:type II toxin-antitoxin system HicB family antitoxin [Niallia circulans]